MSSAVSTATNDKKKLQIRETFLKELMVHFVFLVKLKKV